MEQERFLVFGGSGAVGRFLLRDLARAEVPALAVSRSRLPPRWARAWSTVCWHQGSLDAALTLALAEFSTVLSVGPLEQFVQWIEHLVPARGTRVVALSSMSALWKRNAANAIERDLAQRLQESEQRLLAFGAARGAAVTLPRPTLIYGAGVDANFTRLVELARHLPFLPWPRNATGLRQPVHAEDVAVAVLAASRFAHGLGVLSLPGAERLGFDQAIDRVLGAALPGKRRLAVSVPEALLRWFARGDGRLPALASMLSRAAEDQVGDFDGWLALREAPRAFAPTATDFIPW